MTQYMLTMVTVTMDMGIHLLMTLIISHKKIMRVLRYQIMLPTRYQMIPSTRYQTEWSSMNQNTTLGCCWEVDRVQTICTGGSVRGVSEE